MATEAATEEQTIRENATAHGRWRVDPERAHVGFRVKKMGLYRVKGRFRDVKGAVEFNSAGARAELVIDAASITTRMPPRDLHLRSADFLDVKRHPEITVRAASVQVEAGGRLRIPAAFDVHGDRDTVELAGEMHPGAGAERVLRLRGELDRHDFGIRARQPFEMVVGRQVELDVELVLVRDTVTDEGA